MAPGGRGPRHESRGSVATLISKTGSRTIDSPPCFSNPDSYVSENSIETHGVSPSIFQFDRSLPLNILLYFISLASAEQPSLLTLLLIQFTLSIISQQLIADLSTLFSYCPRAAVTEASSACCWLSHSRFLKSPTYTRTVLIMPVSSSDYAGRERSRFRNNSLQKPRLWTVNRRRSVALQPRSHVTGRRSCNNNTLWQRVFVAGWYL